MAKKSESTSLTIEPRESSNSRSTRRLRREGRVPGVLYGRGEEPLSFSVDARELRHALHAAGAVLELSGDGLHIDLLRVDLNKPIHAPVPIHLVGGEEAPGVKDGGVLEHVTREVTVE